MTSQGNTDIKKAVNLLQEIESILSKNPCPDAFVTEGIKEMINEFTENFPNCWECGDTGFISAFGDSPCLNCNHI